jgi:hypothetical protein
MCDTLDDLKHTNRALDEQDVTKLEAETTPHHMDSAYRSLRATVALPDEKA